MNASELIVKYSNPIPREVKRTLLGFTIGNMNTTMTPGQALSYGLKFKKENAQHANRTKSYTN